MKLIKSSLSPIFGLLFMISFILMAYLQKSIFLDKLLLGSFIFSVALIFKIRDAIKQSNPKFENTDLKYRDNTNT